MAILLNLVKYKIMNNMDRIDRKNSSSAAKKSGLEAIQRELKKPNARASSGAIHSAKEWRMTGMHCQMVSL